MPHVIIIAGSNGSGKSTSAPALLQGAVHINNFVNADVIAQGLNAFQPENAAIQAGRIMLERIKKLANENHDFAFETTLASRTFAQWIESLKKYKRYHFHLIFLWLKDAELAISRVAERIRLGGHAVPTETIRRRYQNGLKNFFNLYAPLANSWRFYDNSNEQHIKLIAIKDCNNVEIINKDIWKNLTGVYHD